MARDDLHKLTASEAAALIRRKKLGVVEYTEALIARIEAREPVVRAWQYFAAEQARANARWVERNVAEGALRGVPIGVKDIIETKDMPTTYGALALYGEHRPKWDASCVALARQAGAVVMGKTVTSEFAGYYTGPSVNPHDPTRSTAFSSMGSAAAVGDFHVPLAFGSQTGGSIIRPAAFCGPIGYMPSYGIFNTTGVHNLAPALDHLGHFARAIDDVALLGQVLTGDGRFGMGAPGRAPRIGFFTGWDKRQAQPVIWETLEAARASLGKVARIVEVKLPKALFAMNDHCLTLIRYEAARTFAHEYFQEKPGGLSNTMRDLVRDGLDVPRARYLEAIEAAQAGRALLAGLFKEHDVDVFLTPSAECLPQLLEEAISRSVFNRLWTILHVPTIAFTTGTVTLKPTPTQPKTVTLPVGIQIVGRYLRDHETLQVSRWLESRLARVVEPMNW